MRQFVPLPLPPSPRNIDRNCITQRGGVHSNKTILKQSNKGKYEMKTLTTLWVVGMFLTTGAMADDVDDVKAAVLSLFAAVNAGAAGSRVSHQMPEFSNFGRGGGLLDRSTSREERRKAFQASVAAGFKLNYQPRNLEVKVYGNTAVVTCYLVGTLTAPNGDINRWTDRRTGVWVTQGGKWREVHMHQSPLNLPQ